MSNTATGAQHAPLVDKDNFEQEVLQSSVPVLVDFYAPWCGPCRAIAPSIDALASEYEGRAKVVKLNVDDEAEIESRYGVKTIPTLIYFKDGQPVDRLNGALPKIAIAERIDALL